MTRTERATKMFHAVAGASVEVPKFLLAYVVDVWNRINATTFRITVTMGVVVTTSVRYQASGVEVGRGWVTFGTWEPSDSWLTFLAVMAGVDLVQFAAKRFSFRPEMEAKTKVTETPPTTTTETTVAHKGDTDGG